MSKILDDVSYLSRTIGPRPAGTQEEQRAALYIADAIQQDSGLSCSIEDFKCPSVKKLPEMICFGVSFVVALIAFFVPLLILPAFIICLVSCGLLVAEFLDKPVLSRVFDRGVSQNVVAKYEPGFTSGNRPARRRKIVLVAHYDSGKSTPQILSKLQTVRTPIAWTCMGALAALPLLLLIRLALGATSANPLVLFVNILLVVALLICLLPLLFIGLEKQAAYNEAANCNASGVSVLMEIARRIGAGQVSAAELAEAAEKNIHGLDEAYAEGVVPEGASLAYETDGIHEPSVTPLSEEERLASAKAAIAALTGKPVKGAAPAVLPVNLVQADHEPLPAYSDQANATQNQEIKQVLSGVPVEKATHVAENLEELQEDIQESAYAAEQALHTQAAQFEAESASESHPASAGVEAAQASAQVADKASTVTVAASLTAAGTALKSAASQIPEWYKKAQAKVHKEKAPVSESQRSRFAEAFDKAEQEIKERNHEDLASDERIAALQESIQAASTPSNKPDQESAMSLDSESKEDNSLPADPETDFETLEAEAQSSVAQELPGEEQLLGYREEALVELRQEEKPSAQQAADGVTCALDPIDVSDLRQEIHISETQVPAEPQFISQVNEETAEYRKPVVLPDVPAGTAPLPSLNDLQQRAPLAVAAESGGKSAAKSLLATTLPALEEEKPVNHPHLDPMTLPSMSGTISAEPLEPASPISSTGSFAAVQATGSFAPVGEELLADVDPEDLYVEDADDSEYSENFTETGAFAGPGYVEMPKGKIRSFFDRFSRKNKKVTEDFEQSTQEWLDVDEDFEARSVGAARGSWESFRTDDADNSAAQQQLAEQDELGFDAQMVEPEHNTEDFEPLQQTSPQPLPAFARRKKAERIDTAFADENWEDEEKNWNGGAYQADEANPEGFVPEENIEERFKQIYQFKHPDLDTEVWLVALGSELAGQAGIKAFIKEHRSELKGALIINLEALGSGKLTYVEKEGLLRPVSVSSRMKRYIRKATQATGIDVTNGQLQGFDSPASYAMTRGLPAMSLAGIVDQKPALQGQADDIIERIDEEKLLVNTDFVMELIKNI